MQQWPYWHCISSLHHLCTHTCVLCAADPGALTETGEIGLTGMAAVNSCCLHQRLHLKCISKFTGCAFSCCLFGTHFTSCCHHPDIHCRYFIHIVLPGRSDRRDSRYRSRSRSRERGSTRPRPGAAGAAAAARGAEGSSSGYPGPPPAPLQQQRGGPEEPVLGGVYRGKVSGIMEFGCFVEVQGFGHLGKKV